MHDLIKLQNFYDGVLEVGELDQLYDLLDNEDNRIVLSYIPEPKIP